MKNPSNLLLKVFIRCCNRSAISEHEPISRRVYRYKVSRYGCDYRYTMAFERRARECVEPKLSLPRSTTSKHPLRPCKMSGKFSENKKWERKTLVAFSIRRTSAGHAKRCPKWEKSKTKTNENPKQRQHHDNADPKWIKNYGVCIYRKPAQLKLNCDCFSVNSSVVFQLIYFASAAVFFHSLYFSSNNIWRKAQECSSSTSISIDNQLQQKRR